MPPEIAVIRQNSVIFDNPKTKETLENFAEEYGFKNAELLVTPGSDKGDNFVGIITQLKIKGLINGRQETLDLVVKIAPIANDIRESVPTRTVFLREIVAYTDILPVFQKLQDEILIKDAETYRFVKCYTVSKEDLNEFLVMENMMLKNFEMHKPRLATLDCQHLEVALSALAKFHSFSYVLKDREPNLFNKLTTSIPDTFIIYNEKSEPIQRYFENAAAKALDAIEDKEMYDKFESYAKNTFKRLVEVIEPTKHAVICHGDYWKNNILFKYKDGRPVQACPLDYQILRHSSPVTDIVYLILNCTTQELRMKHFESLLLFYHRELAKELKNFSLDINSVFPKEDFLAEVKKVGSFGLGMAICVLMFFTCSKEDIPEASDAISGKVHWDKNSESYKMYQERIQGVVEDCIKFGYI